MDDTSLSDIIGILSALNIESEGFTVKFRPNHLLSHDLHCPSSVTSFEVPGHSLLKPSFDGKRRRQKSLKNVLAASQSVEKTDITPSQTPSAMGTPVTHEATEGEQETATAEVEKLMIPGTVTAGK